MRHGGLFGLSDHLKRLSAYGDPLEELGRIVDFEVFRPTLAAALAYGYDLPYQSRPSWETYSSLMRFVALVRDDLEDLAPRDMIDLQSFLWVQGSAEY